MANPKERIGVYSCWSCGYEVIVKKTGSGKLSAPCPDCDFPHYANEGTKHFRNLMAKVKLDPAPAPAAKPPAEAPVAPKSAPARSSGGNPFSGGA
jgi:hypothetical protein